VQYGQSVFETNQRSPESSHQLANARVKNRDRKRPGNGGVDIETGGNTDAGESRERSGAVGGRDKFAPLVDAVRDRTRGQDT